MTNRARGLPEVLNGIRKRNISLSFHTLLVSAERFILMTVLIMDCCKLLSVFVVMKTLFLKISKLQLSWGFNFSV